MSAFKPDSASKLSVGFILLPEFTLLPFSAFIDTLRLSADEGDQSRQIHCQWTVMGHNLDTVKSSCGVGVKPWETYCDPTRFDYIVVVGGRLHPKAQMPRHVVDFLRKADERSVTLVGLCTAGIAMTRAGLMDGRRCCVSWFHYQDLSNETAQITPVADQLFVDDGDRITCAGGAVAADLAGYLVERHLGKSKARASMRIMLMDKPRSASTVQPQPIMDQNVNNNLVKRALLLLEQNMSRPLTTGELTKRLNISRRQLERVFLSETGESLQKFSRKIRLQYGAWLLQKTKRSITDIALECGFSDAPHFSRTFHALFNSKPSDCRSGKLLVSV